MGTAKADGRSASCDRMFLWVRCKICSTSSLHNRRGLKVKPLHNTGASGSRLSHVRTLMTRALRMVSVEGSSHYSIYRDFNQSVETIDEHPTGVGMEGQSISSAGWTYELPISGEMDQAVMRQLFRDCELFSSTKGCEFLTVL